jgi:hypothetical protein
VKHFFLKRCSNGQEEQVSLLNSQNSYCDFGLRLPAGQAGNRDFGFFVTSIIVFNQHAARFA